jgi:NADP-dependent 3-hydroxy acid dehydrogenase YdfG
MSKLILITGATSGFGEASAHLFAEKWLEYHYNRQAK